ncbi:MAG: hypothetical protein ABFD86_22950, partial [Bryobacteraceae bacterium]
RFDLGHCAHRKDQDKEQYQQILHSQILLGWLVSSLSGSLNDYGAEPRETVVVNLGASLNPRVNDYKKKHSLKSYGK